MSRETKQAKQARLAKIVELLKKEYPGAKCSLDFANPLENLVATILSAQTRDDNVNIVTKKLFPKYRTAADYAGADPRTFEQEIKQSGFFRTKTKSIIGTARMIVEQYGGKVPDTMEELLKLPGVARKTANVVLGNAFGKAEGVVVDRHVARIALRIGMTKSTKPVQIEQDLMAVLPRDQWTIFSHLLIFHGRKLCTPSKPKCAACPLNKLCPSAFKIK